MERKHLPYSCEPRTELSEAAQQMGKQVLALGRFLKGQADIDYSTGLLRAGILPHEPVNNQGLRVISRLEARRDRVVGITESVDGIVPVLFGVHREDEPLDRYRVRLPNGSYLLYQRNPARLGFFAAEQIPNIYRDHLWRFLVNSQDLSHDGVIASGFMPDEFRRYIYGASDLVWMPDDLRVLSSEAVAYGHLPRRKSLTTGERLFIPTSLTVSDGIVWLEHFNPGNHQRLSGPWLMRFPIESLGLK